MSTIWEALLNAINAVNKSEITHTESSVASTRSSADLVMRMLADGPFTLYPDVWHPFLEQRFAFGHALLEQMLVILSPRILFSDTYAISITTDRSAGKAQRLCQNPLIAMLYSWLVVIPPKHLLNAHKAFAHLLDVIGSSKKVGIIVWLITGSNNVLD